MKILINSFSHKSKRRVGIPPDRQTSEPGSTGYLDLHGLPPTPKQIEAFVNDSRPNAWPRLIDTLLESPRYGERWGRHWLDVARYADTNGMDEDIAYTSAWRYRDYVIDSFNKDKPFDTFIIEQLAGDLLPSGNLAEKREQTIGTGFYQSAPKCWPATTRKKCAAISPRCIDNDGPRFSRHDKQVSLPRPQNRPDFDQGILRLAGIFNDQDPERTPWWQIPSNTISPKKFKMGGSRKTGRPTRQEGHSKEDKERLSKKLPGTQKKLTLHSK